MNQKDVNSLLQRPTPHCTEMQEDPRLDMSMEIRQLERDLAAANARIAELERECEYDQRNAAMSQSESVRLLDRIAELEAELAALKAGVAEQYDQIGRLQESNKAMWAKEAKAVKELAALKEAGRWHKASEPPDSMRCVMAYIQLGDELAEMTVTFYDQHLRDWDVADCYKVIAWRELPQAPKEGE